MVQTHSKINYNVSLNVLSKYNEKKKKSNTLNMLAT